MPRRGTLLTTLAMLAAGCATAPPGPDAVRVEPGAYGAAFEAAVAVANANRLPPVIRDRRSGVIEAGPAVAASLLEPWHDPGATFQERLERTIQHYRRRARFEFVPAGAAPTGDPDTLTGADVLGLEPATDRTSWPGPLELRVRVFLEQSHRPGLRPDTWSRQLTTYTEIVTDGSNSEERLRQWDEVGAFARHDEDLEDRRRRQSLVRAADWTPVVRDVTFERRLLAEVEARLRE